METQARMNMSIDKHGNGRSAKAVALAAPLTCALMSCCVSCEKAAPDPPAAAPPRVREASPWRERENSITIAVSDEADAELAAAIRQAQATAEQARLCWEQASSPAERERWAVKWAARLAPAIDDEGTSAAAPPSDAPLIEHVWVRPLNWSPFRIEGILATAPLGELESGKRLGDLVSFPIEELSDWVYFLADDDDAAFEGGFTIKALQQRYGEPERARARP